MKRRLGEALTVWKKFLLIIAALTALSLPIIAGALPISIAGEPPTSEAPKVKVLFDIPVKAKTFDRSKLDEDLTGGIRNLYQDNGYFKVVVRDPILMTIDGGKATNIVIPIKEGNQYRMGRLVIRSGNSQDGLTTQAESLEARKNSRFHQKEVTVINLVVRPFPDVHDVNKTIDLTIEVDRKSHEQ